MIRQDPILIAAPPRSGTTLLAAILNAHGVWMGRGRTTRYPGTNMDFASENQDIKVLMKIMATEMNYKNWQVPFPDCMGFEQDSTKQRIESFVPEDTQWLVKTSWCLIFWGFWLVAYPKARWLFPYRDAGKILDSMERHPGMARHPWDERSNYIMALVAERLKLINTGARHYYFEIEDLVALDRKVICEMFDFLEIKPDFDIIEEIVKPEMMKV